jgi:spore coat polysaccharide biosynthesis protein SpsF
MGQLGIIVQGRMGSTRLPGKVLMDIAGAPALVRLFERLRRIKGAPKIVLATSHSSGDDPIAEIASSQPGVSLWRGSEQNVLERYADAARQFDFDPIIRITADNPLTDPGLTNEVLDLFRSTPNCDYADNIHPRTVPYGLGIQIVSQRALLRTAAEAATSSDKEHVLTYILDNQKRFRCSFLPGGHLRGGDLRLTLDYPEDLTVIRAVYDRLYATNPHFVLADILELRQRDPGLFKANSMRGHSAR